MASLISYSYFPSFPMTNAVGLMFRDSNWSINRIEDLVQITIEQQRRYISFFISLNLKLCPFPQSMYILHWQSRQTIYSVEINYFI